MSTYQRPDNPLISGRWYTARQTFNGRYSKNSDFVEGREYRYRGSSHSHYDSATSMTFRDREGLPVNLWWEDGEPPSLLEERFGAPIPESLFLRLRLWFIVLAVIAASALAIACSR